MARTVTSTPAGQAVPAGRVPTQARAVARRSALLDAAAEVLRDDGAANLRITEVARRSGVAVASLYQYFPTRQALLAALAERELGERTARLRSLGGTDAPTAAVLEAELRSYVRSGLDPGVRELLHAMQADPELRALDRRDTAANAAWLAARLSGSGAGRAVLTRRLVLVIELAGALALRLPGVPEHQRRATVDDFLTMVRALLAER